LSRFVSHLRQTRRFSKKDMILRARGVLPVSHPFIDDGALVIKGGRITAVGRCPAIRRSFPGEVLDLGATLLLPGLVNAHCHLDYTDMAGQLGQPRAFPDWIKGLVSLKSGWGYSEYAMSWVRGANMLLRSGVTTVADIEAVPELLPEVWGTTPLRVISFLELLNVRSWHSARQLVAEAEARLQSLAGHAGRVGLSPHAPYTTSPDLLQQAAAAARRHGWLLASHVAESKEEFEMFTSRRGALFDWLSSQRDTSSCGLGSPLRFLARLGLLGPDFLAVHFNYLAEGDVRLLADSGASVVHCPRSHRFFRHQRFPLNDLTAAAVNVCLGTDSLASIGSERREPPTLDLFAEMRALAGNEPELSAEAIVRMATVNGARALGKERQAGELIPGAQADLAVIPFRGRSPDPWETVLSHTCPVRGLMIGGRWAITPEALA
jgi:aminodeoxyfutalosine deaminase